MPQIGDINVPDDFRPTGGPAPARPGLGAIFAGGVEQALGQVRYGVPYAVGKAFNLTTAADDAGFQKGLADSSVAANAAAPASLDDLRSGKAGFGRFLAENLVASAPQTLSSIAGGVVGGAIGGARGALLGATGVVAPQFVGSNVSRAVQEEGGLTQDAAQRSIFTAPFQAASDALVERYLPGVGGVLGDFAAKQTGNFIARTAKSIVKAGATEAVTEAGQQLGERYAAGLDVTGPQAAAEYVNAAVTAFAVGGVLGAGGGIRRTAAHTTPAAEVTVDNLNEAIDVGLAPKPAISPVSNPSFPAPVPGQSSVLPRLTDQRVEAPIVTGADGTSVTPAQQAAGLDPSVLAQPAPTSGGADERLAQARALADQAQAVGEQPGRISAAVRDILAGRNAPDPSVPDALRAPAPTFDPATALQNRINQAATSPLAIGADGQFNGANVEAVQPRLFKTEPVADLYTALAAKNASPEVKAEAQREVDQRVAEATGAAPLTADNFQTRVDDVKQGLRNQFVQKLTAADPTELLNKVYDRVLVDQDTSAGTTKLAQRLGLLDADLNPTPAANAIEAQRTAQAQTEASTPAATPIAVAPASAAAGTTSAPAAPVSIASAQTPDPTFKLNNLLSQAGVQRVSQATKAAIGDPVNAEDARQKVFSALATDSLAEGRGSNAAVTQVEKLAQHLGLITNDDARDVTPLGRQTYLASPQAAEDVSAAAVQQGYTGAQAAIFNSGVQAQVSGIEAGGHTSFEDLAAYQAGKVYAQDFVSNSGVTAAQTNAIAYRKGTGPTKGSAATGAVREAPKRAPLTAAQVQAQGLNNLLDAAELRNVPDTDVAALRKLVRDGADPATVGKALEAVQGGKTLFKPAPAQERTFVGERPSRGQPTFKELNVNDTPSKAQLRAENEAAVRAFNLRDVIRNLLLDKEITVARADKLNDMLDEGRINQVERIVNSGETGKAARLYVQDGGLLGTPDIRLEQFLTGLSFNDAAKFISEHAPSEYQRALIGKVLDLAKKIEAVGGHKFEFKIAQPGDQVPVALARSDVRAYTQITQNPPKATVWLKGIENGSSSGISYQLAAHEFIHAVTLQTLNYAEANDPQGNTDLGKAAKDLRDLARAVQNHLNDRLDNGDRFTHTNFELNAALNNHNAFQDPHEILAWGLTNPEMQRYLQSIQYTPQESVFSRLVTLVRDLLGIKGKRYDTALTELLRVSEQVFGASSRDLAPAFVRGDPNGLDTTQLQAAAAGESFGAAARTATATNDITQQVSQTLGNVVERLNLDEVGGKARKALFGWVSRNQLDRQFGARAPWLIATSDAERTKGAIRGRFQLIGEQAYQNFQALERSAPETAKRVGVLAQLATEFQLDPNKTFDEHEHLKDSKNIADLQRLHREAVGLKNALSRGDGDGIKIFNDLRALNEAQNTSQLTASLHALIATDPEFALGVTGSDGNPVEQFQLAANVTEPTAIRDYWAKALDDQVAAVTEFIRKKKGEVATGTESDRLGLQQHLSPIEAQIASIHAALAGQARAPYFHLGRYGDYFGTLVVGKNKDGTANPAYQQRVALALEKAGFGTAQISADNTKPRVALRFETALQAKQFQELARELHQQGILDGEDGGIQSGPRSLPTNYGVADGLPAFVQANIANIENSPAFQAEAGASDEEKAAVAKFRAEAIQLVRDTWLEHQPDNSISKVLTKRFTVPGYSNDFIRNFAHRSNVGAVSIASIATQPRFAAAITDQRAQVRDSLRTDSPDNANRFLLADLAKENSRRLATQPLNEAAGSIQKLTSFGHSYFLGFSPAYGLVNLTQIGVTALPELAKANGYGRSFHALRRGSATALSVLKAATLEAAKLGPAHYADLTLTDSALQKAGLKGSQLDFVRRIIASGTIDIGSAAAAFGRAGQQGGDSKFDTYQKYASAVGLYTEAFSRLATALAAHDLHKGDIESSVKYATGVVSNALFDYQSWNTARQLGRQGFAGPITPLLTQFSSYSVQITEKLYSEALDAFSRARPGETDAQAAERRSGARTFLAGHLTAVTALAGTLGLPFASVAATAIERFVGATRGPDEPPYDATAAYRNFLAGVFGKDVAEVVARGAPRALGFDVSGRAGEQDLLPFSQLLGDRRSWKESVSATLGRTTGASPGALLNFATAGEKFSQGDFLGGAIEALPVAFKGPAKAYQLTTDGYVDSQGRKLPLTPGASDILYQVLGFSPEQKAEYSEARGDQQSRRLQLTTQAGQLRNGIVKALTTGDGATAQELIARAQTFDQSNPAFAVIPSLRGAVERQASSQARARALGTPLGVPLNDIAGQRLTDYANVNYQ